MLLAGIERSVLLVPKNPILFLEGLVSLLIVEIVLLLLNHFLVPPHLLLKEVIGPGDCPCQDHSRYEAHQKAFHSSSSHIG